MTENIMYIPAVILLAVEAGALTFLILAWFAAKRKAEGGEQHEDL